MSVTHELTCKEIVDVVTDYLENDLPARVRERFDRHLACCPGCVTYVDQIRETIRLTGTRATEETLSPELRETLLHRFRDCGLTAGRRSARASWPDRQSGHSV